MSADGVARLLKRSEKAWARKGLWESMMSDVMRYGLPQRNGYNEPSQGAKKGHEVFDSTMPRSIRKFSNKLVNMLFPPYRTWAKLEAGPMVEDDAKDDINDRLQKNQAIMFSVIHNMSAFQTAIGELAIELSTGTGIMLVERGPTPEEPVLYIPVPEREVAFEEGPRGKVGAKFRRGKIRISNIKATWKDAKNLPDEITAALTDKPETEVDYQEVTYTDTDGQVWYDVLLPKHKAKIVNRKKNRDPWVVARFMKAAGETQGRGPAMEALPDAKTLNKLVELILKNATLAVTPIYTVTDDGVTNPAVIQLAPGEFVTVARNFGHPAGPSIAEMPRAGDFNVAQLMKEELVDSIKTTLLDKDLPPLNGQPRTAAEILERVRSLVEELGATYGRIVTELIVPLVQNTLDVLAEWKLTEPIAVNGVGVKLTVTSPLAALQNLEDVENVVRAIELVASLFGPEEAQITFNTDEIKVWISRKLAVPEELIRDKPDRDKMKQDIAERVAAAEQQSPGAGLATLAAAGSPPRVAPRGVGG